MGGGGSLPELISPAVRQILAEMAARGISVYML